MGKRHRPQRVVEDLIEPLIPREHEFMFEQLGKAFDPFSNRSKVTRRTRRSKHRDGDERKRNEKVDDDVFGNIQSDAFVVGNGVDDVLIGFCRRFDAFSHERIGGDVDLDKLGFLKHFRRFADGGGAQCARRCDERRDATCSLSLKSDK